MNQEKFIGIDLHSNNFTCCIIYYDDTRQKKTFKLDPESLERFYEYLDENTYVLLEASTNSFSFYDLIKDKAKEVLVGNTHKLKLISFVDKKTDKIDAEKLAKYLKMQIKGGEQMIEPVYVPEPSIRNLRALFTTYQLTNKHITSIKNRIHSILKQNLHPFTKESIFSNMKIELIKDLPLSDSSRFQIIVLFDELNNLKIQKKRVEEQIKIEGSRYIEEIVLLTSMTGISVLMALAVIADMADVKRFRNASKFSSYLRSTPGVDQSNEKSLMKGTSRFGRKLAVTMLTQSYFHFKKCNPRLNRWYESHGGMKRPGVIRMAILRNVLVEMFHMLNKHEYHWYRNEELHDRKMKEYKRFLGKNGIAIDSVAA